MEVLVLCELVEDIGVAGDRQLEDRGDPVNEARLDQEHGHPLRDDLQHGINMDLVSHVLWERQHTDQP